MDRCQQARFDRLVVVPDHRLERRNHVADHIFRRVVQQDGEKATAVEPQLLARNGLGEQRMLCDGEDMRALGLAVPARDAGESVRDVLDLDVERGRIEQIEPSPRQHALPGALRMGAGGTLGSHQASLARAAWRWQLTTWSLTMPTACMK